MHASYSLMSFILHYSLPYNLLMPTLKNNPLTSVASLLIQMATHVFPPCSSTFLDQFGTPTLLWRVLSSVKYLEAPRYMWVQTVPFGDVPWYNVTLVVSQNPTRLLWRGWSTESDRKSPWEATQVAALDVLMDIAQSFGDELVGGPATSIPPSGSYRG